MGSQMTKIDIILKIWYILIAAYMLLLKIDEFWNPFLETDGFPGTHGAHANRATVPDNISLKISKKCSSKKVSKTPYSTIK